MEGEELISIGVRSRVEQYRRAEAESDAREDDNFVSY